MSGLAWQAFRSLKRPSHSETVGIRQTFVVLEWMLMNSPKTSKTFPAATGFTRAEPPVVEFESAKKKAIDAYKKQAQLTPLSPQSSGVSTSLMDKTDLDEISLEDLLDSDRKAAG